MSSRVEELLAAAVDGSGTDGLDPPQSRNEKLLFALNDKLDNVKSALAGKVDGPADRQAYQQLVTDGEGKVKWEDRLAYETEPVLTEILPEQNFTGTRQVLTGESGLILGQTYTVKFDNTEYECICVDLEGVPAIGNLAISGIGSDTGEPFLLGYAGANFTIFVIDETNTHTVSVSGLVSTIKRLDEKFLPKGLIVNIVGTKSDGLGNEYLLFDKTDEEINNASRHGSTVALNYYGINIQYNLGQEMFWAVLPYTTGDGGITKLTVLSVEKLAKGWIREQTYITASTNPAS